MNTWTKKLGGLGALLLSTASAQAGMDDGTLTVALSNPVEAVDIYMGPASETAMTTSAVFNPLVAFDTAAGEYVGVIAESWTQVDDTTLEFKLKPDLVFQDGSALNADDVAYTINFISNPDKKFRLKTRYIAFAGAEKVDDLTVRVKSKFTYPLLMARMIGVPIYPSDSHEKLGEDFASWGRAPIGSGPYKVVEFDDSTGIVMERWDGYQLGPLPDFERIVFKPLPDVQTQIAEMMVGNIDLLVAKSPDQVMALTSRPGLVATPIEDMNFQYMYVDTIGRSGLEVFQDKRVREAVFHAIDRDAIRENIITGGKGAEPMDRLCFPYQIGCPEGGSVHAYDPERAKELLTEAGYPEGFDLQVSAWGPSIPIAQAVVGYMRAVGIRANVDILTLGAYRKKQVEGGLQALVSNYVYGGLPDAGADVEFFFTSPDRDYTGDERLFELAREANGTHDAATRADLFTEAFDRIESEALIIPLTKDPIVTVHSSEVSVNTEARGDILFAMFSFFESFGDTPPILGWADE